jgi:hypothetical protein
LSTGSRPHCHYVTSQLGWMCDRTVGTARRVDCVWNVMAHAQKRDFVFRRNRRVHLNRQGASVQLTTGSRGVRISGSNAGYTMFRGSVKGTGYQLHMPVSPSLPHPCVTVFHQVSTGLYYWQTQTIIFIRLVGPAITRHDTINKTSFNSKLRLFYHF